MKPARPKRTRLRASGRTVKRKRPELSPEDRTTLEGKLGYTFKTVEWLHRAPYATYDIIERSGPDHEPVFLVEAKVEGHGQATDKGRSRQEAEMAAADRLLRDLIRNAG